MGLCAAADSAVEVERFDIVVGLDFEFGQLEKGLEDIAEPAPFVESSKAAVFVEFEEDIELVAVADHVAHLVAGHVADHFADPVADFVGRVADPVADFVGRVAAVEWAALVAEAVDIDSVGYVVGLHRSGYMI